MFSFLEPILDTATDVLAPVTEFVSDNSELLGLGVSVGTAYYGYQQQQEAIDASEAASNRALALQKAQNRAELESSRLQAPNESATLDVISSRPDRMSLQDFLYENEQVDTSNVGLNTIKDYEKSLGIGA